VHELLLSDALFSCRLICTMSDMLLMFHLKVVEVVLLGVICRNVSVERDTM